MLFLIDYINYHYSVYARKNAQTAFDELIKGGAKLTDPDVWEVYVNTINGMNPYLKQVSDNYADFCQRFGKKMLMPNWQKKLHTANWRKLKPYATMKEKIST